MPPRLNTKLTPDDVADIKLRLWNLQPQHVVAELYNVTQTTISRIARGTQHYDVRWPNGDVGGMPAQRVREIQFGRRPITRPLTAERSEAAMMPKWAPPLATEASEDLSDGSSESSESNESGEAAGETDAERIERYKRDKAARSAALEELAEQADARMQAELAAAITATPAVSRVTSGAAGATALPHYELEPWENIVGEAGNWPLVRAAELSDNLRYCLRAAFKLLPRSRWRTPAALQLVRKIASSRGIDLEKELINEG